MPKPSVIAIVDDDEAVREALFDLLQVEGMAARIFDRPAALLAEIGRSDFGCVVTDVCMPGFDGLELQRRLRASGFTLPLIFITSIEDEALRDRAMREGAVAWFTKPVPDAALLATLRSVLGS
ncbi:MAG TPA: response regulator [Sphingomonas sp.]|nr:response regulator [Sphingomonas sp.]